MNKTMVVGHDHMIMIGGTGWWICEWGFSCTSPTRYHICTAWSVKHLFINHPNSDQPTYRQENTNHTMFLHIAAEPSWHLRGSRLDWEQSTNPTCVHLSLVFALPTTTLRLPAVVIARFFFLIFLPKNSARREKTYHTRFLSASRVWSNLFIWPAFMTGVMWENPNSETFPPPFSNHNSKLHIQLYVHSCLYCIHFCCYWCCL